MGWKERTDMEDVHSLVLPMTPGDAITMKGLGATPTGQTEGAEIEPGLGG